MVRQLQGVILVVAVLGLGAWLPRAGISQAQEIVFSEVNVSSDGASLSVELESGDLVTGEISNGEIRLNGDVVGEYTPGDDFDASWRALLGGAISADPGELANLLAEWTLPEGMTAAAREGAEALRSGLRNAVEAQIAATDPPLLDQSPQARSALQELFQRSDRLRDLAQAIDDLDPDGLSIRLGESVRVEENETLEGSLLIVDGDLTVDGTVEGDVVLLGGSLDLGPDGRIEGTVRTADAEISGDRDRIEGGIVEIVSEIDRVVDTREVEVTIRDAVREATADARRSARDASFRPRSPLRWIGQGLAGLAQTLVTFAILFGAGLAVLYFFPRHLEVVSRTLKRAPGRSLFVGLAGLVLALPLFVVGIVLLAVSIIGIPLLLVWIPLVPLALAASIAFGYVAVARNLGGWFSTRELRGFEGLDRTRPAVQIGTGLAILLASLALGHVFHMGGPIFGIFQGFLMFVFVVGTMAATSVGLGAVILTRAGRNPGAPDRWETAGRDPRTQDAPSNA